MNKLNAIQRLGAKVLGIDPYESGRRHSRRRTTLGGVAPSDHRKTLSATTRKEAVKRSRIINSNHPIAVEGRRVMADLAVGCGSSPIPQSESSDWNAESRARFKQWARNPDVSRQYSLPEIERMCSYAMEQDGEIFAHWTRDTFGTPATQMLESHRISSDTDEKQRIFQGIQYNGQGRPVAYYIDQKTQADMRAPDKRVAAGNMLHIYDPQFISEVRPMPSWQAGLLGGQDRLEIMAFESGAWKMQAEAPLILTSSRESALDDGDFGFDADDDATTGSDEEAISENLGLRVQRLDEGERLDMLAAVRPGSEFKNAMDMLDAGLLLGVLPKEAVLEGGGMTGPAVRMVLSKIDRRVKHRKSVIDSRLLSPLWFRYIGWLIDTGELPPIKGWWNVRWTAPRSISIDAGRDSQQARADIEMGRKLWSDDIGENGGDFEEHFRERARQWRRMQEIAAEEGVPMDALFKSEKGNNTPTTTTPDQ